MTEQEKRGKVIKGLERCIEKLDTVTNKAHGFNCTACPYFRKCDSSGYLIGLPLMRDAIALLKAQEPRVMALEEVVALPEGGGDVWIENTSMPGIPPWIIAATLTEKMDWQELGALWFSDDCCHYVADYNLDTAYGWRCWTSRPTDEQREATPWA